MNVERYKLLKRVGRKLRALVFILERMEDVIDHAIEEDYASVDNRGLCEKIAGVIGSLEETRRLLREGGE